MLVRDCPVACPVATIYKPNPSAHFFLPFRHHHHLITPSSIPLPSIQKFNPLPVPLGTRKAPDYPLPVPKPGPYDIRHIMFA
jgi:hypothetical protein